MLEMNFDEFNKQMRVYSDKLDNLSGKEWDELYEHISSFQYDYMNKVLEKYKSSIDCDAKECIYELLSYAVNNSETGNSIIDVETKELVEAIKEILWDEIGDYLLDYEIYEENNHWVVDCMFAGNYVPYWDGWGEC